ncbi:uncharacterized protein LOC107045092 [Diachasma alloeum]|uniref:uncharacterized protein LOC107045092 n=1 Tax=Diachasma alloeum TaxID=454923 RepID=UPI00073849E5|nr:uncharacterized protein LOC107045092 [Diachasma alloeum]
MNKATLNMPQEGDNSTKMNDDIKLFANNKSKKKRKKRKISRGAEIATTCATVYDIEGTKCAESAPMNSRTDITLNNVPSVKEKSTIDSIGRTSQGTLDLTHKYADNLVIDEDEIKKREEIMSYLQMSYTQKKNEIRLQSDGIIKINNINSENAEANDPAKNINVSLHQGEKSPTTRNESFIFKELEAQSIDIQDHQNTHQQRIEIGKAGMRSDDENQKTVDPVETLDRKRMSLKEGNCHIPIELGVQINNSQNKLKTDEKRIETRASTDLSGMDPEAADGNEDQKAFQCLADEPVGSFDIPLDQRKMSPNKSDCCDISLDSKTQIIDSKDKLKTDEGSIQTKDSIDLSGVISEAPNGNGHEKAVDPVETSEIPLDQGKMSLKEVNSPNMAREVGIQSIDRKDELEQKIDSKASMEPSQMETETAVDRYEKVDPLEDFDILLDQRENSPNNANYCNIPMESAVQSIDTKYEQNTDEQNIETKASIDVSKMETGTTDFTEDETYSVVTPLDENKAFAMEINHSAIPMESKVQIIDGKDEQNTHKQNTETECMSDLNVNNTGIRCFIQNSKGSSIQPDNNCSEISANDKKGKKARIDASHDLTPNFNVVDNIKTKAELKLFTSHDKDSSKSEKVIKGLKTTTVKQEDYSNYDSDISELEALNSDDDAASEILTPEELRYENLELSFDITSDRHDQKARAFQVPIPTVSDDDESEDDDDSVKDKDYEVESDEESDSECDTESIQNNARKRSKNRSSSCSENHDSVNTSANDSANSTVNHSTNLNESLPRGAPEAENLVVPTSDSGGPKKNFCCFCKTMQSNMSRHLTTHKKTSKEVQEFLRSEPDNPIRKEIIGRLRAQGDYLYNTNPDYNKGQLLVARRPHSKLKRDANDFAMCHQCRNFFSKNSIRHHRRPCLGTQSTPSRANNALSKKVNGRVHPMATERFQSYIHSSLRNDEVGLVVSRDEFLFLFGNHILCKYEKPNQREMVRTRLRLLARILLQAKEVNKQISDFASLFNPLYYKTVIQAVNAVAEYDPAEGTYGFPSNAHDAGTYLKKAAQLLIVECIEKKNGEKKKDVEDCLTIYATKFPVEVAKTAREAQVKQHRQNKDRRLLPATDNIIKLWDYLISLSDKALEQLNERYSFDAWKTAAETTLIMIQIFNRKRAGELERMELDDLKTRERISEDTNPELFQSLSNEDKAAVMKYCHYDICGKLGRTVPVLLTEKMERSIGLIQKYRSNAMVPAKNPYVFGMPGMRVGGYRYLRACRLLKVMAVECAAQYPDCLRGTALRKDMATACASENASENSIFDVPNFLGQSEEIHRNIYRQPVASRDLCNVSRFSETAIGMKTGEYDESDGEDNVGINVRKRGNCNSRRSNKNMDDNNANSNQANSSEDFEPSVNVSSTSTSRSQTSSNKRNRVRISTDEETSVSSIRIKSRRA